ncbi:hypothetical protein EMIHUDRAFT_225688 [Emiliania huxleyi CCMP1516]|uniref:Uncharacterized protein n=2 Tax=Emiliania huxleyi TaxID=2903 RepID=A0A0D3KNB9_EMIH1|nr:hypothetical protein EMIHUDRAFT_225688 [Emiliania huxleyi CCMP1516]EOD37254.1 hypothetical protein EMIHUDRAFT_225688 [Emiliania huxleyi CCMP1516]|eukprot:XP_005789683.1 hypothetical protein EMIHUDRAFT_225688 [Emiliania huxleyi CCMP1516]
MPPARTAAVKHARQERSISNGQYYVLLIASLLLLATASFRVAYLALEAITHGLRWSRLLWSSQHEEFRVWTGMVCSDPWQAETVLCQAAGGSWLARELIRAKLATAEEDHCGLDARADGCRFAPCAERGLSSVLLGLADSRSPLNNPFDKLYEQRLFTPAAVSRRSPLNNPFDKLCEQRLFTPAAVSRRSPLNNPFDKLYEQRLFTPAAVSRRSPLNNPFDKLYEQRLFTPAAVSRRSPLNNPFDKLYEQRLFTPAAVSRRSPLNNPFDKLYEQRLFTPAAVSRRSPLNNPFDKHYEQRLFTPAAVSRRSPLNNPFDKLYLLDRVFHDFPWGERVEGDGGRWGTSTLLRSGTDRAKAWLFHKVVYPALREWGVVIGGSAIPPPRECRAGGLDLPPAASDPFSTAAQKLSSLPEAVATTVGDTVAEMFSFALEVSDWVTAAEAEAEEEDAPNANTSESEAAESAPRRRVMLVQRQRFRAVR